MNYSESLQTDRKNLQNRRRHEFSRGSLSNQDQPDSRPNDINATATSTMTQPPFPGGFPVQNRIQFERPLGASEHSQFDDAGGRRNLDEFDKLLQFSSSSRLPKEPRTSQTLGNEQQTVWPGFEATRIPQTHIQQTNNSIGVGMRNDSQLQALFSQPVGGQSFPPHMSPLWRMNSTMPHDFKPPPMVDRPSFPTHSIRPHHDPPSNISGRSSSPISLEAIEASLSQMKMPIKENIKFPEPISTNDIDEQIDSHTSSLSQPQVGNILSLRPLTTLPNYTPTSRPQSSREAPWARKSTNSKTDNHEASPLQAIMAEQLFEKEELERHERERTLLRKTYRPRSKGPLMTRGDKDLVNRIQLSQLKTENPYVDDYYFYSYNLNRTEGTDFNEENRRQASSTNFDGVKKLSDKANEVVVKDALGRISLSSIHSPRLMLQLRNEDDLNTPLKFYSTQVFLRYNCFVMNSIERVYDRLIEIEELDRQMKMSSDKQQDHRLTLRRTTLLNEIGSLILDPKLPVGLSSVSRDMYLLSFLQVPKAKLCLKLVIPYLMKDDLKSLYLWLLSHIEQLEVCRSLKSPDIGSFVELIINPCSSRLSECDLSFFTHCLSRFLDHTSKESRLRVFVNPAGLSLLSTIFSHVYALFGKIQNKPSSVEESSWKAQFDRFFNEHTGTFIYLFSNSSLQLVWEFISSIASLSDQQQKIMLLIEVRDKVLEHVAQFKGDPNTEMISSVNGFLNCLGLNVDLLLNA